MTIAIDFDGTVVTHEFPKIGEDVGAVPVLKELVAAGHLLVLNTMRSGNTLHEAIKWFYSKGIPLHGINENPSQKTWTSSPKVYAELYINDAALGAPLFHPLEGRPSIDWTEVRKMLVEREILE